MPRLTDPAEVRALLATDRAWAAYPLGDLAPGFWEQTTWFGTPGAVPAIIMLFRGFTPPVLFALGPPECVRPLLDELGTEPEFYLHIPPAVVGLLEERYRLTGVTAMWRMVLDPSRYRAAPTLGAVSLGPQDLDAVGELYRDGEATGEEPGFFAPSMVAQGVFFGIREGAGLVAIAGTHLVVPAEGVAAVGNVYTRRDRRGHGLGAAVTTAVATELLRRGLPTVVLNVAQTNTAAVRLYLRLGFEIHAAFCEGRALRR
jgi:ribosomal protein S18 acetylase RimI-like enzyme